MSNKKSKVVLVDWGVLLFRAIFVWRMNRAIPMSYTALNIMLSCLADVGVTLDDLVVIAVDGRDSWRKKIDSNYKANRKEFREGFVDVDWENKFAESAALLDNIEGATPFYTIQISHLEADDIIATAVRYYQPQECVIISSDKDYEQLAAYKHVKIYSERSHHYKIIANPYKILAQKIRKEPADNLTTEVTNEEEYKKRELVVSLLSLPPNIEQEVHAALKTITGTKTFEIDTLCYHSLVDRLRTLFESEPRVKYGKEKKVKRKRRVKKQEAR